LNRFTNVGSIVKLIEAVASLDLKNINSKYNKFAATK